MDDIIKQLEAHMKAQWEKQHNAKIKPDLSHIRAVVTTDLDAFRLFCRLNKLKPYNVIFVHIDRVDKELRGFYAEDVYPPEYGGGLPSRDRRGNEGG